MATGGLYGYSTEGAVVASLVLKQLVFINLQFHLGQLVLLDPLDLQVLLVLTLLFPDQPAPQEQLALLVLPLQCPVLLAQRGLLD